MLEAIGQGIADEGDVVAGVEFESWRFGGLSVKEGGEEKESSKSQAPRPP